MKTTTFSTARHQATAGALAFTLTLGMLLTVSALADRGAADAQMAGKPALVVAAPAAAASGA